MDKGRKSKIKNAKDRGLGIGQQKRISFYTMTKPSQGILFLGELTEPGWEVLNFLDRKKLSNRKVAD